MNNTERIQELIRTLDATLSKVNPEGLPTGHNAILITNFLMEFPNMKSYIDPEFTNVINEQSKLSSNKTNVREHVKKILMYPKYEYDAWTNVNINNDTLNTIHNNLSTVEFKFCIIDGKVYATPTSGQLSDLIFNATKYFLPTDVISNTECSHVTVVNSNIVHDIGIDKVTDFVNKYQNTFHLNYFDIKSTVSRDWCVFSKCYVIQIKSEYMNTFINDFNSTFQKSIKPNAHITFGIVPRSLF